MLLGTGEVMGSGFATVLAAVSQRETHCKRTSWCSPHMSFMEQLLRAAAVQDHVHYRKKGKACNTRQDRHPESPTIHERRRSHLDAISYMNTSFGARLSNPESLIVCLRHLRNRSERSHKKQYNRQDSSSCKQ